MTGTTNSPKCLSVFAVKYSQQNFEVFIVNLQLYRYASAAFSILSLQKIAGTHIRKTFRSYAHNDFFVDRQRDYIIIYRINPLMIA